MFAIDYMSLAVATSLIALFVVPLYLHIRKTNRAKARAIKRLEGFAASQGLVFSDTEIWRNRYFLGLDRSKNILIYTNNLKESAPICIELGSILRVSMIERYHEVVTKVEKRKVFDSIELHLITQDGRVAYRLEVYDGNRYSDLDGEAVLGRKWEQLLQQLHKSPNPSGN
ncbi:MAG: hypothetical protein JJU34_12095 [Lunatimonas sp.]|uniref:hypothetical protein n=1 Tax=Lunatimonas sp. TaxID=2060141 RepID=UPI00263ADEF2|nr:hypothetical protein [Lunatimonas sp.]MCC5938013.1 hypothetical protein [Lunatimonas sp.]